MDDRERAVVIERAKFDWPTFGRTLVVWLIDVALTAIVVAVLWFFIFHIVFNGVRVNASVHDISDVLSAITWPITVVLIFLLFRNPLLRIFNEIPTFIRRSYYRRDDQGNAVLPRTNESQELGGPRQSNVARTKVSVHDILLKIAEKLTKRFGGRYFIEKCIGDQRWMFDIVIETENHLYGVELKINCRANPWEEVFERVNSMYAKYGEDLKRRFVFVAVIADNDGAEKIEQEVMRLAQKYVYVTFTERMKV